jgi:hypothetical protein
MDISLVTVPRDEEVREAAWGTETVLVVDEAGGMSETARKVLMVYLDSDASKSWKGLVWILKRLAWGQDVRQRRDSDKAFIAWCLSKMATVVSGDRRYLDVDVERICTSASSEEVTHQKVVILGGLLYDILCKYDDAKSVVESNINWGSDCRDIAEQMSSERGLGYVSLFSNTDLDGFHPVACLAICMVTAWIVGKNPKVKDLPGVVMGVATISINARFCSPNEPFSRLTASNFIKDLDGVADHEGDRWVTRFIRKPYEMGAIHAWRAMPVSGRTVEQDQVYWNGIGYEVIGVTEFFRELVNTDGSVRCA